MESHPIVPSVALIINLALSDEGGQISEKSQVLAAQLSNLGLSATWVIDEPAQAQSVATGTLATTVQELALTAAARSPQRLRSELANRQAAVQAASGQVVSVIVGDPLQLRARATLLADLGIRAVVSSATVTDTVKNDLAKPPRPLPCGLWQLDSAVTLPQTRSRWSLLPSRRLTVARLLTRSSARQPIAIAFDLGRFGTSDLRSCQQLLQAIAEANRQQQLTVATVSEVVAQLARQHEVKPQCSILRRAA